MDTISQEECISRVGKIFMSVQVTASCHQKNSMLLKKMYETYGADVFYEAMTYPISRILETNFKQKNFRVELLVDFLSLFLATLKCLSKELEDGTIVEDALFSKILNFLLSVSDCNVDGIRYRACHIISKLLDHIAGDDINEELFQKIEDTFLEAVQDTVGAIRLFAVKVLYRLQDPQNSEDQIIRTLIKMMGSDSNAKVRTLCVEKIAYRKDVIQHLIERTRDINATVRFAAFDRLSRIVKYLKIIERRVILTSGKYDPSKIVKNFVFPKLLDNWLESFSYDILLLMKAVRLDGSDEDISKTVDLFESILTDFYFKTKTFQEVTQVLKLNEQKLLPYGELNWETVSYWKLLVDLLKKNDDYLDTIIPEAVYFCDYLKGYMDFVDPKEDFLERQFIIKQLFNIIKSYDYADPTGRQALNRLVEYVLKNYDLMDDVIENIIDCLKLTMPDANTKSSFVCLIISDLLYPLDADEEKKKQERSEFELSQQKVKLNILQEQQNEAIAKANFMAAEKLQREIESVSLEITNLKNTVYKNTIEETKKRTDLPTTIKCLDIAAGILRTLGITHLTPSLRSLKSEFIDSLLIIQNDIIQMKALRCYAMYCIYDKGIALNGIHVLVLPIFSYQAGEECDTQILCICISAVVDLIRIHGTDLIAKPDDEQLSDSVNEEHQKVFSGGTSLTQLVQGLVDLMDDEYYEIQKVAVRGLCQLVLNERIHSSSLICRLILKWAKSLEKDEPQAPRYFIAFTLKQLPHMYRYLDLLKDAVILTVRTLASAPPTSFLSKIDLDDVMKFMIALCKTSLQGPVIHYNIAKTVCSAMVTHPRSKTNITFSKMLLLLDMSYNKEEGKELLKICHTIRENITVKTVLKNLTKFMAKVAEKFEIDMASVINEGEKHVGKASSEESEEDPKENGNLTESEEDLEETEDDDESEEES